jgi:hypothetical protein
VYGCNYGLVSNLGPHKNDRSKGELKMTKNIASLIESEAWKALETLAAKAAFSISEISSLRTQCEEIALK